MPPHVVTHNAVSVDGRIDGFAPDVGRYYELAGTWEVDAHLVGADTLIEGEEATGAEEPTGEEPGPTDEVPEDAGPASEDSEAPLLVVTDSRGRVRTWPAIRDQRYWSDLLVLCSETTPQEYVDGLREDDVPYEVLGEDRVDLRAALVALEDRGVETVLVDSGGTLNGHLFDAGLVDEVSVLVHPALVGGTAARSFVRGPDPDAATDLDLIGVDELADDLVWLRYRVES